jgi:ABC-type methionine transport system ATPase subunit
MAAQQYLRDAGIGVDVVRTTPYKAPLPSPPDRVPTQPSEPKLSKKLWVTFIGETRREPLIWEMSGKYDVTFDIRQSSTGESVSIMAVLLSGPQSHVEGAIEFLQSRGAEIEPIEKTVIEG